MVVVFELMKVSEFAWVKYPAVQQEQEQEEVVVYGLAKVSGLG